MRLGGNYIAEEAYRMRITIRQQLSIRHRLYILLSKN